MLLGECVIQLLGGIERDLRPAPPCTLSGKKPAERPYRGKKVQRSSANRQAVGITGPDAPVIDFSNFPATSLSCCQLQVLIDPQYNNK
jgi:hypothetical protein